MNFKFRLEDLELSENTFRMKLKEVEGDCNIADSTLTSIAETERQSEADRLESNRKDEQLDGLKSSLTGLLGAIVSTLTEDKETPDETTEKKPEDAPKEESAELENKD